jgi:preprotein translocase subunit SecF
MDIIPHNTHYDFVGKQKPFLLVSLAAVLVSVALIFGVGINFGIDFKGGSEIVVGFKKAVNADKVREASAKLGFEGADVQSYGGALGENQRYLIRVPRSTQLTAQATDALKQKLAADLGEVKKFTWTEEGGDIIYVRFAAGVVDQAKLQEIANSAGQGAFEVKVSGDGDRTEYTLQLQELQNRLATQMSQIFDAESFDPKVGVESVQSVGPRVGQQLRGTAVSSLLLSLLGILVYVGFRFDIRYAPGGVIALFHDVIITVGVYTALRLEFTLTTIAGLLTIIGYSINDTIIIYDRIRETLQITPDRDIKDAVNHSVNSTLSRTILTSGTTLFSIIAMFIFGNDVIRNLNVALFTGIVVGTYSSTFVASPVVIIIHNYLEKRRKEKEAEQAALNPPAPTEEAMAADPAMQPEENNA